MSVTNQDRDALITDEANTDPASVDQMPAEKAEKEAVAYFESLATSFFVKDPKNACQADAYPQTLMGVVQTMLDYQQDSLRLAIGHSAWMSVSNPLVIYGHETKSIAKLSANPNLFSPHDASWAHVLMIYPSEQIMVRIMATPADPDVFIAEIYPCYDHKAKSNISLDAQELGQGNTFFVSRRRSSDFVIASFVHTKMFGQKMPFEDFTDLVMATTH